jgi:hypothetical protein
MSRSNPFPLPVINQAFRTRGRDDVRFPLKEDCSDQVATCGGRRCELGVAHPEQRKALTQLQISGMLSQETIEAGSAPFVERQNTIRGAIEQHILRTDLPGELLSKMLAASAEAIMDLIGFETR